MSTPLVREPRKFATPSDGVAILDAPFVFDITERRVDDDDLEDVGTFGVSRSSAPRETGNIRVYRTTDGLYICCRVYVDDEIRSRTCFPISFPEYLGEAAKLSAAQLMESGPLITRERTLAALQNYISKAIKSERIYAFARVGSRVASQQQIAASVWQDVRVTNWYKGEAETIEGERLFDIRVLLPDTAAQGEYRGNLQQSALLRGEAGSAGGVEAVHSGSHRGAGSGMTEVEVSSSYVRSQLESMRLLRAGRQRSILSLRTLRSNCREKAAGRRAGMLGREASQAGRKAQGFNARTRCSSPK